MNLLTDFFQQIETFDARFQQIVLDEERNPLEESHGRLWIKRPGRFRWDYEAPLPQTIVSDGEKVWIHDIELEQVTVRAVDEALGRTPAILLAGTGDLSAVYDVADGGEEAGVEWVNLRPLASDTPFENIKIGFADNVLQEMELADSLGQLTRITFSEMRKDAPINNVLFDFRPPDGVDVLDESDF